MKRKQISNAKWVYLQFLIITDFCWPLFTFGFVQVKWESIFDAKRGEKEIKKKVKQSVNCKHLLFLGLDFEFIRINCYTAQIKDKTKTNNQLFHSSNK